MFLTSEALGKGIWTTCPRLLRSGVLVEIHNCDLSIASPMP